VKTLLDHGADTEAKVEGATPSLRQSTEYHFHIALAGATPLWLAARFAEPEIMRLLVENGADATTINYVSYPSQRMGESFITEEGDVSVLMAALGMGHRRMTVSWGNTDRRAGRIHKDRESAILDASVIAVQGGANINLKDASGQTALDFAKVRGYDTVVLYLLGAGAREELAE
jgi:ankyrin repeat protein